MSCTDAEFAKSMRGKSAEELFRDGSPFTAEELDTVTARERALSQLAFAIANATYAARRDWDNLRDELESTVAKTRAGVSACHVQPPYGVWLGRAYLTKWMGMRAAVCLDCEWVGPFRPRDRAAADVETHSC